jgi:hypothetical protein
MKTVTKQKLPRGWTAKKIRDLIRHYDNQSDEEGATEIESAPDAPGETWLSVPTELVPTIVQLIDRHAAGRSKSRRRGA